jgi:hypothetical protein
MWVLSMDSDDDEADAAAPAQDDDQAKETEPKTTLTPIVAPGFVGLGFGGAL